MNMTQWSHTSLGNNSVILHPRFRPRTNALGACMLLVLSLAILFPATGGAATISPGETLDGAISVAGETDSWTFTASAGDAIVVRVGDESTTTFTPKIQLLSPTSVSLGSSAGAAAAEVAVTATNTGTFTIIVSDNSGTLTGPYRLSLAKTGSTIVVSPGDQGGPMTNGVMHTGTILTGDLDVWTFNANSGDAIAVRAGEITDTNTFYPWVRLYSPGGTLLSTSYGTAAAEVSTTAASSGTFIVVVSDGNGGLSGSGDYRLTLAKTGDPVVVSAGDQGGPLTNAVQHLGIISTGDLDVWTFNGQFRERDRGAHRRDHRHQHVLSLGAFIQSQRHSAEYELRSRGDGGVNHGCQQRHVHRGGGRWQRRSVWFG